MPGDLNLKKSWNPALLKNQKKVWEREQEALKEYQTIKQKSKEIASEREKEEMIRLQYGSDPASMPSKQKLELNKLGWMYDGPKDQPQEDESGFREVEEDFLSNTKEMESLMHGSRAVKNTSSRFDHVASVGAAKSAPSSLKEDPLLMIKKQRRVQGQRSGGHRSDRVRSGEKREGRERSDRDRREERERSGRSDRHRGDRHSSEKSDGIRDKRSDGRSERSHRNSRPEVSHGGRSHRDRSPGSERRPNY